MYKLQTLFGSDKTLFLMFHKDTDYNVSYGFDTLEDMWNANPSVTFKP